ncbi:MAG: Lon protease family protein [Negativicutes bacterium]
MTKGQELSAEKLRFRCDPTLFSFETTAEVSPLDTVIGQDRAVKAVNFGLFTKNPEYNIYISGPAGTGKLTFAEVSVRDVAAKEKVPSDWCYVNNFMNSAQPIAISLPAGIGKVFSQEMQELIENLKTDISKVFSSDDYEQAKVAIVKGFQEQRAAIIEEFNKQAEKIGIMPQWMTTGFVGVPLIDGKPITPEEYQQLPKEKREEIDKKMMAVHEKAMEVVRTMQQMERVVREELKALDSKVGLFAVGHLLDELSEKHRDHDQVGVYLDAVKQDIVKNINDFKPQPQEDETNPMVMFKKNMQDAVRDKYRVNLLIDNSETKGAPVVIETNPSYYNLIGRVEYEARMGLVSTDYTMIKPGAFHKANGGYLIIHVKDLLSNIQSWEALKRVLKTKHLHIENLGEQYGMLAMSSLKPQPIPINVRVILIGNPYIYQLLYQYDEDFQKLFKVHADFDVQMANTSANIQNLAAFVSSTVKRENLKHFDRMAVAKVVEHCTRLTENQKKLTTRFNEVVELLCEADVWATLDNSAVISEKHIKQAIEEKRYRANKYEERVQELFAEGVLLLDTEDERVGQVNGLAVMSVGEYMFGKPSRITANTYLGRSGIINIERETKMSGTTHTKGVLTLSGYIGQKYAQKQPLTLTASLTFEQLYEGVDGDSASSTELYALLSSLSGLPIKQYIAVTGSVNQKGEVQPIGGATEKIEGFFAVCKIKGLTGRQGVMIPQQNIAHLALNDEVIQAVQDGQFHIYPVRTIDEGIEVLTGVEAGLADTDGNYPPGTVHYLVNQKLREYMETMVKIGKASDGENKTNGDKSS